MGLWILVAGKALADQGPEAPPPQAEAYRARAPKSVVELQQFRRTAYLDIEDDQGRQGTALLIDVNPLIHTWFLLHLQWEDGKGEDYHLENPAPEAQRLALDPQYPQGLVVHTGQRSYPCELWSEAGELKAAAAARQPYAPLCGDRLYLRKKTQGHKTSREWATDFLRRHVWGGEQLTTFVRQTFYKDAFLHTSEVIAAERPRARPRPPGAPARPLLDPAYDAHLLVPDGLGIELEREGDRLLVGRWYPVREQPGIFVCALQAGLVAREVVQAQKNLVKPLDEVEVKALVYLIAFDLEHFEAGFALGTEHPSVEWSGRIRPEMKVASLPGPDGIGTMAPLVHTGMLNPAMAERAVAAFTGGFKRYHGAFKWTELAPRNYGSHYGFVEHGAVLSKLQPGLSTFVVLADGRVEMKTWSTQDDQDLGKIRHARQNGVPLVEIDPASGQVRPGKLVHTWSGNWSGSVDGRYRTLRAGLCLAEHEERRFLIYGYFSGATPSAMARVFQSCGCQHAMHLDMNALEHTYLAVYPPPKEGRFRLWHLIEDMKVLDKSSGGQVVPRFVGYADNRDFFYLLRKEEP